MLEIRPTKKLYFIPINKKTMRLMIKIIRIENTIRMGGLNSVLTIEKDNLRTAAKRIPCKTSDGIPRRNDPINRNHNSTIWNLVFVIRKFMDSTLDIEPENFIIFFSNIFPSRSMAFIKSW